MRKIILLISTYFPPCNASATRRIESFARYWPDANHRVIIITNGNSDTIVPTEFTGNPNLQIYYVPYPKWVRAMYNVRRAFSGEKAVCSGAVHTRVSPSFLQKLA